MTWKDNQLFSSEKRWQKRERIHGSHLSCYSGHARSHLNPILCPSLSRWLLTQESGIISQGSDALEVVRPQHTSELPVGLLKMQNHSPSSSALRGPPPPQPILISWVQGPHRRHGLTQDCPISCDHEAI